MKNIFLTLALMFSVVCAPTSSSAADRGSDGYYFLRKSVDRKEIRVKIVTYSTVYALQEALKAHMGDDAKYRSVRTSRTVAFSVLELPDYDVCTIHMVDPEKVYQPDLIGHEFLHCVYGQWHN